MQIKKKIRLGPGHALSRMNTHIKHWYTWIVSPNNNTGNAGRENICKPSQQVFKITNKGATHTRH